MKTILKWFWLLNKRLYKKATFVVILVLIPLVVLGLSIVAKGDSGFVSIALVQTDDTDPISNAVVKDLTSGSNLLRFELCDTPQEAIERVRTGGCDSAWIIFDDLSNRLSRFVADPNDQNALANVVEREQNVLLRMSHEKLSSALYKYISKDLYLGYIRTNISQLDQLSNDQLIEYYDSYFVGADLFEFSYPSKSGIEFEKINYLVAPVRGLLSVLVVLCAMASSMFFVKDQKNGTFSWVAESKRIYIEFLCQIIAVLNVTVAMIVALVLADLNVGIGRELFVGVLYAFACALFGMLLRNIFNSNKVLGALIPLIITAMIALCPVFFEWKEFKALTLIFPPTYYINAANNTKYAWYLVVYVLVCTALILGLKNFQRMRHCQKRFS